jgi:hypothetical protein
MALDDEVGGLELLERLVPLGLQKLEQASGRPAGSKHEFDPDPIIIWRRASMKPPSRRTTAP